MNCVTISIPNLPDPIVHPIQAKRTTDFLKECPGLIGIHPHWPHGTILFFDTLEHARYARAKFVLEGNKCGRYAMNAELSEDGTKIVIDGVAEDFEKK